MVKVKAEESKMTFYTSSKIQDVTKSMLEVQARIENGQQESRNVETIFRYQLRFKMLLSFFQSIKKKTRS